MIRLNRMAHPVTTLGFGRRVGLWVQGCARQCPDCNGRDTWPTDGGTELPVSVVAKAICEIAVEKELDGLTITGGEPFDQADALCALIDEVKCGMAQLAADERRCFDVLVFSGYEAEEAAEVSPGLWSRVDAAVCGPYRANCPSDAPLLASGNQCYVCLTEAGQAAHRSLAATWDKAMQFSQGGRALTFAGITDAGDLNCLEEQLQERGISMGEVSWKS